MKRVTGFAALTATTFLTACGGNSSPDEMTNEPGVLFAVNSDGETITLVDAAAGGTVFMASGAETSALTIDRTTSDNATATTAVDVTFQLTADGGLIATLNGEETVFAPATKNGEDGFEIEVENESYFGVYGQSESIDELLTSGDQYAGVVSYFAFPNGENSTISYNVIGARTAAADVPQGEATYYGFLKGTILPATGYENFGESNVQIQGDLRLDVTMDGQISGVANEIEMRNDGETFNLDGEIIFADTAIVDGAYAGGISVDAALMESGDITDANVGTYSGLFYGPAADEAVGTMTMSIMTEDGPQNGAGFFATDIDN